MTTIPNQRHFMKLRLNDSHCNDNTFLLMTNQTSQKPQRNSSMPPLLPLLCPGDAMNISRIESTGGAFNDFSSQTTLPRSHEPLCHENTKHQRHAGTPDAQRIELPAATMPTATFDTLVTGGCNMAGENKTSFSHIPATYVGNTLPPMTTTNSHVPVDASSDPDPFMRVLAGSAIRVGPLHDTNGTSNTRGRDDSMSLSTFTGSSTSSVDSTLYPSIQHRDRRNGPSHFGDLALRRRHASHGALPMMPPISTITQTALYQTGPLHLAEPVLLSPSHRSSWTSNYGQSSSNPTTPIPPSIRHPGVNVIHGQQHHASLVGRHGDEMTYDRPSYTFSSRSVSSTPNMPRLPSPRSMVPPNTYSLPAPIASTHHRLPYHGDATASFAPGSFLSGRIGYRASAYEEARASVDSTTTVTTTMTTISSRSHSTDSDMGSNHDDAGPGDDDAAQQALRQLYRRREQARLRKARQRAAMSEEQRAITRERNRISRARRYAAMTEEERERLRERDRLAKRRRRQQAREERARPESQ